MIKKLSHLSAPAKLNLFLHITGKRPDNYHNLESVFVLIDLADSITLESTEDGSIARTGDVVGDVERDLCVRAARLLKEISGTKLGVKIDVTKRIPSGAGMGGGSSDAATTLLGLCQLWGLPYGEQELINIGCRLGADVPFFIFGRTAFAQGIGEILSEETVPPSPVLILMPQTGTNTARLFADPMLTRDTPPIHPDQFREYTSARWPSLFGRNDMQAAAINQNIQIKEGLELLGPESRMTGSGSAVFRVFSSEDELHLFVNKDFFNKAIQFGVYRSKILQKHPLRN